MSIARLGIVSLLTLAALALAGCSSPHPALNPRPVIYTVSSPNRIDLCSLIPESKRSADLEIFYATNRVGSGSKDHREYGNDVDNRLHLGVATIHIGDANTTWDDICNASSGKTNGDPQFQLAGARELDDLPRNTSPPSSQPTPTAFVQAVDRQLALSPNHQINVYVHGFKTYFSWEVEVLAKLFHCTGRRGAMVCFGWPSRQSLYLYGSDVERGQRSATHLADLIEVLAKDTNADKINILSYSCGASCASEALMQLRKRYPNDSREQLAKRLRIGNVIFAASDIDLKTFANQDLVRLNDLADNVVIYISHNDAALGLASFGFGASRLGRPKSSEISKEQLDKATANTRLQVIDVSDVPGPHNIGGFGGHGYWFANDWIMTDLLVVFRWQIPPDSRGLVRHKSGRWFFPKDYPQKVTEAVHRLVATTAPAAQR